MSVGRPEGAQIVLELRDVPAATTTQTNGGVRIDSWKSYSFNSSFLAPSDGWSFTLGDEQVSDAVLANLTPGQRVTMTLNGHTQGDGYIDRVSIAASRSGGTELTVEGRDRLSPVIDSGLDPQNVRFTAGQTLLDIVTAVFAPFGWPASQYLVDSTALRSARTGAFQGTPTTKLGKPLKSYVMHQLQPYPHEGAFGFAARVAHRFGLWIWLSADGASIIVGRPTYDQPPTYRIRHKRGAQGVVNNVLESHVERDQSDLPSVIIATGFGTGGENPHGALKIAYVSPITGYDTKGNVLPAVLAILALHPEAKLIKAPTVFPPGVRYQPKYPRPLYLHDDESKTLDQLAFFTRREMAVRLRRALTCRYTVDGHEQAGVPWATDCIVDVDDDVSNIHEPLWILGRTFVKDRHSGTRTELELIRQHTLEFIAPDGG